jgi:hypothetical protein
MTGANVPRKPTATTHPSDQSHPVVLEQEPCPIVPQQHQHSSTKERVHNQVKESRPALTANQGAHILSTSSSPQQKALQGHAHSQRKVSAPVPLVATSSSHAQCHQNQAVNWKGTSLAPNSSSRPGQQGSSPIVSSAATVLQRCVLEAHFRHLLFRADPLFPLQLCW